MLPNGSRVGGWLLNTLDNDLEAGMGQSYGLIVSHNDWKDSVDCTKEFLKKRGYTVAEIPNGAKGVEMLKQHSLYLKSCDRLFVYFAGHGGSRRPIGDSSKDLSLTHDLQFEDGELIGYDRIAPSLQLMSYKGVDLSVLDGSCDGGEAVLNAIGERYLAMSTTTVLAPGLTNTPNPSEVLKRFGRPSKFGMWWSDCYAASLLTSITPRRFYQKIYRNDNTEINLQSLFYKPAIDFYAGLGSSWTLSFYCCYLHKYIFPDDYNDLNQNDKDKITVSTADYLALMKSMYDAQAPYIAKLNTFIGNSALVDRAGDVYGQFYPKPWQTIFGDMDWNLAAEPSKYSSLNNALIPGNYAGKQGFLRMVAEVKDLLTSLKQVYSTQEGLLKQIDVEILKSKLHSLPFKKQPISTNRILDYKKFNVFEKRNHEQLLNVLKQVNSKPTRSRTLVGVSTSVSELKVASKTIMIESELVKKKLYKNMYGVLVLNELIADLKTSLVDGAVYLDKLHYLLVIVEEAISKVQSTKAEPGDLCSF
jgi:hypothetical protein